MNKISKKQVKNRSKMQSMEQKSPLYPLSFEQIVFQNTQKTVYHFSTKNETGRSMTEMLGVLAVIGVLSIGGIQGYTYAMNKYRANNILNELNIASHDLATALLRNRTRELTLSLGNPYDLGRITSAEYPFNYGCGNGAMGEDCSIDETGYWMTLNDVPENICKHMLTMNVVMPYLAEQKLNGNVVTDGVGCVEENNEITFLFNSDGSGNVSEGMGGNGDGENGENNTSDSADTPQEPDPFCGENGRWNESLSKCVCKSNYVGDLCNKSLTDSCIENGGYWWISGSGKVCHCGYDGEKAGPDCSLDVETACNGQGYWYSCGQMCDCKQGWTGSYCDKQIDENNYCNGHGQLNWSKVCECNTGYGGINCEKENPCKNGGVWVNDAWRGSGCVCSGEYTGETCEEALDSTCDGHGIYKSRTDYIGGISISVKYCSCTSGYAGKDCSKNETEVCGVNGSWYNYEGMCRCDDGYTGEKCEITLEEYPCVYGTYGLNYCYCQSGYAGKDCSKPESEVCKNGFWKPSLLKCVCKNGWTGENCDVKL